MSLSREKKSTVARPKNMYASTFNKSKFGGSSGANMKASKLKGIFATPPNPLLNPRKYEGETVMDNHEL